MVAQWLKRPNVDFGRTPGQNNAQKDRFVILGSGTLKRGKKSWRETFEVSPGQKLENLMHGRASY